MKRGRLLRSLTITAEERESLERWARRAKAAQALAQPSRIVLVCTAGATNSEVTHQMQVAGQTMGRGRRRFL